MLLLNLADIHFRFPECASDMDPNRAYRSTLVRDLRVAVTETGKVDIILVAGDIAYHGIKEEYKAALEWLTQVAAAAGCSLSDILVVPGNHDVDRKIICRSASVRNAQHALLSANGDRRDRELIEQLIDKNTGPALLEPLSAYNDFAAQFNCQVYAPDKLFWHQERALSKSFSVRFYGLTSTLLSGAGANRHIEDTKLNLYLSSLQTVLEPIEGVINLVMCHHPPDWFIDQEDVDDAIRGRSTLQLFGHKHRQRIHRDRTYVRFSAGAVNPDRRETLWEPGFNLIKLRILDEEALPKLDVEAHLFTWQTNPDRFRPKLDENGHATFRHRIELHPVQRIDHEGSEPTTVATATTEQSQDNEVQPAKHEADGEVVMSEPKTRHLVLRFWNLASSERRSIARTFNLVEEDELGLPDPEKYGRALIRASERGLLEQLAIEITRAEQKKS